MAKVAVIVAPGCEEGETLTIVDILRRADIECHMVGLGAEDIAGTHGIVMRTDMVFSGTLDAYDMVVLPGGYGGTDAMRENASLVEALRTMDARGAWVCAICAAPEVLGRAGLLAGRRYTCYPGVVDKIENPGTWVDAPVVIDANMFTGQGPAFAYAFAYALIDALGGNSEVVKQRMVYHNAFDPSDAGDGEYPLRPASKRDTPLRSVPSEGDTPLRSPQRPDAKVAVLMTEGFEESETVQIVDLLARAGLTCHTFRFQDNEFVRSMQGMYVKANKRFGSEVLDYDVIVVPGGRTAAAPLIANKDVMETLRAFNEAGKLVCGMCSGTTVLEAAGVLSGKRATGYTGYAEKLKSAEFVADEVAVWDANVVTSQGPATPYPFAFKIMEALGINPQPIKDRLLYHKAGGR